MREPPVRTRIVGHPVVATGIGGLCALGLYGWVQNPDAVLVGVGSAIGLAGTAKAADAMRRYRAWQREWDGMAGPAVARPAAPRIVAALVGVAVVGGFAAVDAGLFAMEPDGGQAITGLLVLAVILAGTVALWRAVAGRVARPRATPAAPPVAIRAVRPVMPVPAMTNAYSALPSHCWDVLGR